MARLSRPVKTFTTKQGQYLAFIHLYTRLHRRPPAEADLQEYCRVSPPSVHQMVLTLEQGGFIRRQPRPPRSIEVLLIRGVLSLAGDIAARFEAGVDSSVGVGRVEHPLDTQGCWGPAADCQPLAASPCR